MRVMVTGGLGFIGSNFVRDMLSNHRDAWVINVDNMSYGSNPANLKDVEGDKRYRFVKGDIANKRLMGKLVREVDFIVNFAAETHVDRSIADPWPFLKSNVEGVLTILEAVRLCNKAARFIQVGTDETYGDILKGSFREGDRLNPSSPYAASKAAADMLCSAYHRTYGLDIVVTRCTNNFGPYQFPEKLIPKTIIRASMNLKIPIYGSGRNVRDWIYVHDHCEALNLILEKGRPGEIYNISSGNEFENLEVAKRILEVMRKDVNLIEFVEDRPGHDVRYSLNSNKLRRELNWKPRHSFDEALRETVQWYVENEEWWKPIATEQTLHPTPWKLKW